MKRLASTRVQQKPVVLAALGVIIITLIIAVTIPSLERIKLFTNIRGQTRTTITGPTVGPATIGPTANPTAGPTTEPTSGPTSGPIVPPTAGPTSGPATARPPANPTTQIPLPKVPRNCPQPPDMAELFGDTARYNLTGRDQTVVVVDSGFTSEERGAYPEVEHIDLFPGYDDRGPSHSCKSYSYGYETLTPQAHVVVLRSYKDIYVNEPEDALPFLLGIRRALLWVEENAISRNITTIQISALDGYYNLLIYNSSESGGAREGFADVSAVLTRLRTQYPGIWISAPTGNLRSVNPQGGGRFHRKDDDFGRIFWPARHPLVTAIGCEGTMHRSPETALLMPSTPTSRCNIYACALSMIVREAMLSQCHQPRELTATRILEAMKNTARSMFDPVAGSNMSIAQPMQLLKSPCGTVA